MVEGTVDRHAATQPRQSATRRLDVAQTRLLLVVVAIWVALFDLVVKLIAPTESGLFHKRSHFELFLILAITAAAIYFVPLARSGSIALGAGLMTGGGIGNAVSIMVFPLGVPNPIVVSGKGWTVAFNLADIGVTAGCVLMMIGVSTLTAAHRHELGEPIDRR